MRKLKSHTIFLSNILKGRFFTLSFEQTKQFVSEIILDD